MTTVSKEATLSEVLAEVSILDFGKVLKQTMATLGCLAIFVLFSVAFGSGIEMGAHYALPGLSIPSWVIWLCVTWFWIGMATADKSFHRWEMSWYFPKLRWWASFIFAAYVIGGFEIYFAILGMDQGASRVLAAAASYFYLLPLWVFVSVINIGHTNLMAKREANVFVNKD